MNRRQFLLQTTAAAIAAPATLLSEPQLVMAAPAPTQTDGWIGNAKFTDQDGKPFDIKSMLNQGPALVVFGYGGCPLCQEITKTVAAVQKSMLANNQHVPIIVIDVIPETSKKNARNYADHYQELGVAEHFPGATETSPRALTNAYAASNAESYQIETRIANATGLQGQLRADRPKQHLQHMFLVDHGKLITKAESVKLEGTTLKSSEVIINNATKTLVEAVNKLGANERSQSPSR